ncbi:MAG TPA: transporter [Steroidobacteraceae bacterium]|nr:transporter [Steroidobacteraceae bacterium]
MSRRRSRAALFAVIFGLVGSAAFAGHPMLSEDTGTQGRDNVELELGYDWSRQAGDHSFLFQPQLSWGASTTLDLIVQPSWIIDHAKGGTARGSGDTNLDAKWRFYGSAPWSLGIRAGVSAPTARDDLGLQHDRFLPHAMLVATGDFTPFTLDANLGYGRAPADASQRGDLYHFSAAVTVESGQRLFFILDTSVDSNPDRDAGKTFAAVTLLGIIYTVRPGLDVDVGFRGRLNGTGPAQQWLVGITFRGAP